MKMHQNDFVAIFKSILIQPYRELLEMAENALFDVFDFLIILRSLHFFNKIKNVR